MDNSYGVRVLAWVVVIVTLFATLIVLVLAWHALHSVLWPVPVSVGALIAVALIGAAVFGPGIRVVKENTNPPPENPRRPTTPPVTSPTSIVCQHCGQTP